MGAPKQKWTSEEEDALRAGVAKHGTGKWKNIQKDPEFSHYLAARSNIDLKDKWRNMSVSASGQGSRDKIRAPKLKALPPIAPASASTSAAAAASTPAPAPTSSNTKTPTSNALVVYEPADTVMESSKSPADGKASSSYNTLIFEAIATLKDPTGSDISSIIQFIESKQVIPPNFRRLLSSKLRRLVTQEKLEKVHNGYKIKKGSSSGPRIVSNQKQKDDQHSKQSPTTAIKTRFDEIEEAAKSAAYMIADAENKAFMASEAIKEAERVAKMVEESDSLLQFSKDIYERCIKGEIMLMA